MRPSGLYRKLRPFLVFVSGDREGRRLAEAHKPTPGWVPQFAGSVRWGDAPDPSLVRFPVRPTFAQFCEAYGLTPDTVPDEGLVR